MMIEQNYNLDLVPSGTPLVVYVSQFDKGGRRLSFTLYKDNVAFTLPTGASATILGTKPDKIAFMYAMQTSGNKLYIDVTEQMTAVAGPVQCEIRVSNTAGEKIGSSNFIIYCEKTPLDSDAVISETDIPVFEELVAQANSAAAEANTASTQAQQYAQQAQESAESIDVSALEAQIASKAPSVSPTLKFAIKDSADGNTNPHAEFRTMGSSPNKSVGFAVYDENGNGNYYDLIKGDGTRYFATVPEVNAKAPIDSPTLTGTPTAPTASVGTSTTQIATTAFVVNELTNALYYKSGDTFSTISLINADGMITYGNRNLFFTLSVDKLMSNVSTITVTACNGSMRGIGGYINGADNNNYNWLANATVTATKASDRLVRITCSSSTAFTNATVNTPTTFYGTVTLSFS